MSELNDYVKMKHFIATMAISTTLMLSIVGYTLSCIATTESKIDNTRLEYIRIESRLAEIQTDILWIKREINNR